MSFVGDCLLISKVRRKYEKVKREVGVVGGICSMNLGYSSPHGSTATHTTCSDATPRRLEMLPLLSATDHGSHSRSSRPSISAASGGE